MTSPNPQEKHPDKQLVAHTYAHIGTQDYLVDISAGRHKLAADEPPGLGGTGAGFAPYELLLSSLAACTAITLRMYARRKQWVLQAVEVDLRLFREGETTVIERKLAFTGALDAAQQARLLDISERTPVTLTLKGGTRIDTSLRGPAPGGSDAG
jgi:putative redox protein